MIYFNKRPLDDLILDTFGSIQRVMFTGYLYDEEGNRITLYDRQGNEIEKLYNVQIWPNDEGLSDYWDDSSFWDDNSYWNDGI